MCAADLLGWPVERVAKETGIPVLLEASIKVALDLEWSTPDAKSAAINMLAKLSGAIRSRSDAGATATATPLATDLDQPTGVAVARGSAWVTEGQLGRLFAMPSQPPNLPFSIRRVDLHRPVTRNDDLGVANGRVRLSGEGGVSQ